MLLAMVLDCLIDADGPMEKASMDGSCWSKARHSLARQQTAKEGLQIDTVPRPQCKMLLQQRTEAEAEEKRRQTHQTL